MNPMSWWVGRFWCLAHYPLLRRFSISSFKKNNNAPSNLVPLLCLNLWHLVPPRHLSLLQISLLRVSSIMITRFVLIVGSWGILWIVATSYMGTQLGISPNPRPNWALFSPPTIHYLSLSHQKTPTSLI